MLVSVQEKQKDKNLTKREKLYLFNTITKLVSATNYMMWESTLWDYLVS